MIVRAIGTLILGLMLAGPAVAVEPGEQLADPALEARARELSKDIRCLVCQNQSIDDSNAGLARDLRVILRERITAGDSDDDIREFLVQRYGDFVLLNPPVKAETYVLWYGPVAIGAFGLLAVIVFLRRRPAAQTAKPLSEEELARVDRLVAEIDTGTNEKTS